MGQKPGNDTPLELATKGWRGSRHGKDVGQVKDKSKSSSCRWSIMHVSGLCGVADAFVCHGRVSSRSDVHECP